jgi:hypothetical protein
MYRNLFFTAIGIIAGMFLGGSGVYLMLKGNLGDKYEIVKPKIKGSDNTLKIEQENFKDTDNKKLKFKRNGKRKDRVLSRKGESQ